MSETLIVMRREVLERVRSRSFVISTLLFPVFMAALFVIPVVLGAGGGERTLVLVDEAPAGVGDAFVAGLTATGAEKDRDDFTYTVQRVSGPFAQVRDRLNARVLAEEIDGQHTATARPIDFVATTGEEGLGDLKGVRHLFNQGAYKGRVGAFFSIDGASYTAFPFFLGITTSRRMAEG